MNIITTRVINNNIHTLNDFIIYGRPKSFLNSSVDSGSSTITVFSIKGFSEGNYYVLIGEISSGNAELIKIHASTAPSGNTITLASNTANSHDANEPVYFCNFNQIEFSRAVTATGDKSVLATNAIDPTKKYTVYCDATNTSGYAFARFKNSDASTYSSYSASAPYANAAFNTIEYIINETMTEIGTEFTDKLTPTRCINFINEGLRDIRRYKNKISWAQSFNAVLGQTEQGAFRFDAPSDIYDKYSFKAIEAIRLGGEQNLIKTDPNYFFNVVLEDVHFTQVRTAASAGDTTLEIDNSYDFADDGSVTVGTQTLTYTGVTRSETAGVLTGIPASGTGAITSSISEDDFVFQDETSSEPKYWTMFNGYIYIYPLPSSSWDNFNVNIDYYKTITAVDDLADTIDYIQYDLIKNWLKWKIRGMQENGGKLNLKDSDFLLYKEQLSILIKKERPLNAFVFRNGYESGEHTRDKNPRFYRDG